MILDKEVSVVEMQQVIARAGLAARSGSAEEIIAYVRRLGVWELMEEYHRAVATLMSRGLLTRSEEQRAHEYAREYMSSEVRV